MSFVVLPIALPMTLPMALVRMPLLILTVPSFVYVEVMVLVGVKGAGRLMVSPPLELMLQYGPGGWRPRNLLRENVG
jgi:hypothetical protein